MTALPTDRLETFDGWLNRYQLQTKQPLITGAELDRLYAFYLNDWSVDSVLEHDRARQEGGLQPIGPTVTLLADKIGEAFRRQREGRG